MPLWKDGVQDAVPLQRSSQPPSPAAAPQAADEVGAAAPVEPQCEPLAAGGAEPRAKSVREARWEENRV